MERVVIENSGKPLLVRLPAALDCRGRTESVSAFFPWTQTDALISGSGPSLSNSCRSSVNNVEIN